MKKWTLILLMVMSACGGSGGSGDDSGFDVEPYPASDLPLIIQAAAPDREDDLRAIEYWNDYFGTDIFELAEADAIEGEYDCSLTIVEEIGDDPTTKGRTERSVDPGARCDIEMEQHVLDDNHIEYGRLLAHELGHVLGMPHTDDIGSLMYHEGPQGNIYESFQGYVEETFSELYPEVETDIMNLDTNVIEGE